MPGFVLGAKFMVVDKRNKIKSWCYHGAYILLDSSRKTSSSY